MKQLLAIAAFIIILTGCYTTKNITDGDKHLSYKQGIVITRIHSNIENGSITIKEKYGTAIIAKLDNLKKPSDLRVFKINAGEAGFSGLYVGRVFSVVDDIHFDVQAGKINYIGDLYITWNPDGKSNMVETKYYDYEAGTLDIAKKAYPELFAEYSYVKSLPVNWKDSIKPLEHSNTNKHMQKFDSGDVCLSFNCP